MRDVDASPRQPVPSNSKGAQRRRRLARGVATWERDRSLCAERVHRVAQLTLTIADPDPRAAIGRVYRFWRKVRQKWLGTRYFCWLELQRRGAVHYHCVWLNPPPVWRTNLVRWVQAAWGDDRTQVRFKQARTGLQDELNYVLKYTDKMKRKSYQQRYDQVPRELRTFMTQRTEIPVPVLEEHCDKDIYGYSPGYTDHGSYIEPSIYLHSRREHVVPRGGHCSALDKRRLRSLPAARAPGRWRTANRPLEKDGHA